MHVQVAMLNGGIYKYGETDRIIFRELIYNLAFALLGIAIISLITLIHPGAVLLIVLCILLVDLGLFAEMWLLDIRLNTVSVVSLASLLTTHYTYYIPSYIRVETKRSACGRRYWILARRCC